MSEETQTEDEPSIEEILDSIRQIISEDDEGEGEGGEEQEEVAAAEPEEVAAEPEPEPEEEPEPEGDMDQSAIDEIDFDSPAEPEEDVLELTELVNTEENELAVEMKEAPEEEVLPEPEPEPDPEPEIIESSPDPVPSDSLLTDNAEHAAVEAMTELVRKTAVEHNGVTLEEIVRAELNPLLRDWLDKHLPSVIERLVQDELERVSKRVLDE